MIIILLIGAVGIGVFLTVYLWLLYRPEEKRQEEFEKKYQDAINKQPTVDKKRHGHWVKENEEDTFFCVYKCSLCGGMVLTDRVHLFKYCPYCGAKMEEE